MKKQPQVSAEELALFRRCRFVHRVFRPYPSLRTIEPVDEEEGWHVSRRYTGQDYDPEQFELIEGGWDHEHCDVCWGRIEDGDRYWANDGPLHVDFCEACYPRVLAMLA